MNGRTYDLVPRDDTGVFLGLGMTECLLISGGFGVTILLRLLATPVAVSAVPLLVAAGAAKVKVSGQPVYQWLGTLAGWGGATIAGRRRWRGSLPLLPAETTGSADLPPVLQGLDVVEIPGTIGRLAAVRDRRVALLTVVLPVRAERFAGADSDTQEALLAGWGDVLAASGITSSAAVQVGWSHQAMPSLFGDQHRDWIRSMERDDPGAGSDLDDYAGLVDEVSADATTHEVVVWLTVSGREIAGKGKLLDRAIGHLPAAVDALVDSLREAGLQVDGPLSTPGLWKLLRQRADQSPAAQSNAAVSLAASMGLRGSDPGWPLACDTSWSEVRIDGSWHRVYWIEAWPRRPVQAAWLSGFLGGMESTTTTVIYRPLDLARSHRRIDSQLVKLTAHRARKEDKARRVTEVERRTEQAVHELETELASGYTETLYLGLVCVTAATREDLDDRCHVVEQAARAAQMGLRLLHGRQDVAWAATLPLGRMEPGLLDLIGP